MVGVGRDLCGSSSPTLAPGYPMAGRKGNTGIPSPVHPQGPATPSKIVSHHVKSLLVKAQGARGTDIV